MTVRLKKTEEVDDDKYSEGCEDDRIEWCNLIFLPFDPVFKLLVLASVVIKTTIGPIQAVYPIISCWDIMDVNPTLFLIKHFYWYACDPIYAIDTFLHIVHRQVTDKAVRRIYLPKGAFLLLLDLLSLIPFTRLIATENCASFQLWPNVLNFNEFLIVYRILEYFSLATTHSATKLTIGFTLMLAICVNCLGSFWVMLTMQGLCQNCRDNIYDWRSHVLYKMKETAESFTTYMYGISFVLSFALHTHLDEFKPSTITEFMMVCVFVIAGYVLTKFIIASKLFSESLLRLNRVSDVYPNVKKVLEETKRRNPGSLAHEKVKKLYQIMWKKRNGIVDTPKFFMKGIPRFLRLDVQQDLLWQVFYHSPTLRKTSTSFQRWLCDKIYLHHKLPDERFYINKFDIMQSDYYFIKSGIVQLISADDGNTPILTFTSGTIFGDVNFLVPHFTRKVILRCLTFCEYYVIPRGNILTAMHNYKSDRKLIIDSVRKRIKHAKSLFYYKKYVRGIDRNEDEAIAWIKQRWWELFELVTKSKKLAVMKCEIPPEDKNYHCPKYLGQLVLSKETKFQTTSIFSNVKFPWILSPNSNFKSTWNRILLVTIVLVLCLYPPNLIKPLRNIYMWFKLFSLWVNLVYIVDIGVSLSTAIKKQDYVITSFGEIILERCKSLNFIMDILATIWLEDIVNICGLPQYYYTAKFNRLLKIYKLFSTEFIKWDISYNPLVIVVWKIILIQFATWSITSHLLYEISPYIGNVTINHVFGENLCESVDDTDPNCVQINPVIGLSFFVILEYTFSKFLPVTLNDLYVTVITSYIFFIVYYYCKGLVVAYLYLKNKDKTNYRYFVIKLQKYCKDYNVPINLLKMVDLYSTCHWQYHKGIDIMQPTKISEEPFDIFWKCQGAVIENMLSKSTEFKGADPALIRELTCAAKLTTIPKNCNIFLTGTQIKHAIWILQGFVKTEYYDRNGKSCCRIYGPGDRLAIICVFFRKTAFRNYIAYTDCELCFVNFNDFFTICKRYPVEWNCFKMCVNETKNDVDNLYDSYSNEHRGEKHKEEYTTELQSLPIEGKFWENPNSIFMRVWFMLRVIVTFISISASSLQGSIGILNGWSFQVVCAFCDSIAWMDIIFKFFLHYHNHNGLLITDKTKCMMNYLTKGFVLDIIGVLPWATIMKSILSYDLNEQEFRFINMICKFSHIYIVFAYFDNIADTPTAKVAFITIAKWVLVNILLLLGASHYLMSKCVDLEYNPDINLTRLKMRNDSWMPKIWKIPQNLTHYHLQLIFAESIDLASSRLMRMNLGRFSIGDRSVFGMGWLLLSLGVLSWFVMCIVVTILLLDVRENTIFQNDVVKLMKFLKLERIDKKLITRAVTYFKYCWNRTRGVNIYNLTHERIGAVFGQDLSYHFAKKTFAVLDELLQSGEQIRILLASYSQPSYYIPSQEIVREMDLLTDIYVVHRGKVLISRNGKKITVLTKGDVFGQLQGTKLRPIKISAQAVDYVDLLEIKVKTFQETINDEIRETIGANLHAKLDFMASKKVFIEDPYDTVQYIVRGKKHIKLPLAKNITASRSGNWYSGWLYITWFWGPLLTAIVVIMLGIVSNESSVILYGSLIALDLLHISYFVAEFYSLELIVQDKKCVYRRFGSSIFQSWWMIIDILLLLVPLITIVTNDWRFQLARLWRLRLFYDFDVHFCRGFKTTAAPVVLKISIITLLIHYCTCVWIYVACRYQTFPIPVPDIPQSIQVGIDFTEWMHPNQRTGCARVTRISNGTGDNTPISFLVPKKWQHDYIVAMAYILLIFTHTNIDNVLPVSVLQIYIKLIITCIVYMIDVWLISVAITTLYSYYRDLYHYDYSVDNMRRYLKDRGLSDVLLKNFVQYCKDSWSRRKGGNWIPELANKSPPCLRQDIYSALYIHHLELPETFRDLPDYFKRQLVTRFHRVVVDPGKYIVKEGDSFNVTYFIHDGEVESWYVSASGENKMLSVLTTNGYFGCISGLFAHESFQFSYYSRTVVDLIILNLSDWCDLLEGYPDIKKELYASTKKMKGNFLKNGFGKSFPKDHYT